MAGVSIQNSTRRRTAPRAVFSNIAKEVLPGWEVSLAFVGPAKARSLNKQLRKKEYVPNVLSYIAGEKNGEIIICPSEAGKQAPAHSLSEEDFILYLFIHGALHISGWVHGDSMERCERKLLEKYGAANSDRHRYRHVPGKDGRRRGDLR